MEWVLGPESTWEAGSGEGGRMRRAKGQEPVGAGLRLARVVLVGCGGIGWGVEWGLGVQGGLGLPVAQQLVVAWVSGWAGPCVLVWTVQYWAYFLGLSAKRANSRAGSNSAR